MRERECFELGVCVARDSTDVRCGRLSAFTQSVQQSERAEQDEDIST